jgi:hypothetical protein
VREQHAGAVAKEREAMLAQWPAGGEAVALQRPAAQAA